VPAANFALLLRAVERYGGQCHPLYVPEGKTRPVPLDLSAQLVQTELLRQARQEIQQMEFGRAAALLRRVDVEEALPGLAEHAQHRLHFDFIRARRVLEATVIGRPGPERGRALRLRERLDELENGELPALIGELYFNLKVTFEAGRYVDFLSRAFRFEEAVLRLVVEEALRATTEPKGGRADPAFAAAVEADPALQAMLGRQQLDYQREPSVPLLAAIVGHLAGLGGADQPRIARIHQLIQGLDPLRGLRNKSIGAHGFRGVSREDVERTYAGDLLADLRELGDLASARLDADPFADVQAMLLAELERR
jgi:hypothetical protein